MHPTIYFTAGILYGIAWAAALGVFLLLYFVIVL